MPGIVYHAKKVNFDGRYNDNLGILAPKSHEKLPFYAQKFELVAPSDGQFKGLSNDSKYNSVASLVADLSSDMCWVSGVIY